MTKPPTKKDCKRMSAFLKAIRLPASQEGKKRRTERGDVPLKW